MDRICAIHAIWYDDNRECAECVSKQRDALLSALLAILPRCSQCHEPAFWEYSDEDGREYLCDKHKPDHFYIYGPDEILGAREAQAAIDSVKGP